MALQIDAVYGGDDTADLDPAKAADFGTRDRDDLHQLEYGLSVNVGDIGKVAIAHVDDKHSFEDTGSNNFRSASTSDIENLGFGDTTRNIKTTTLAAEFSVGELTTYVGTQTKKLICLRYLNAEAGTWDPCSSGSTATASNRMDRKEKTTFFGIRGGLGDTGLSYVFQWRDMKTEDKSPWILGLGKSLGGGASLNIEHANHDDDAKDNQTRLALQVDF